MPETPVVVNNTPLVALWTLDRLDLLRELYDEVLIPAAVRDEFLAVETERRQAALQAAPWIHPATLQSPRRILTYTGLDQGEAEVIALAEETEARLVIIDERRGRQYARRLGIPVTGTVGILLLAKEMGLLPAVAPALDFLVAAGLYLSPDLYDQALHLANESRVEGSDNA